MIAPSKRHRIVVFLIGLLVLTVPALFVVLTLEVLVLSGDLVFGQITLVEFLELYVVDLLLLVGFGYVVYRATLWLVEEQLTESLDALAGDEDDEAEDGADVQGDDPT